MKSGGTFGVLAYAEERGVSVYLCVCVCIMFVCVCVWAGDWLCCVSEALPCARLI